VACSVRFLLSYYCCHLSHHNEYLTSWLTTIGVYAVLLKVISLLLVLRLIFLWLANWFRYLWSFILKSCRGYLVVLLAEHESTANGRWNCAEPDTCLWSCDFAAVATNDQCSISNNAFTWLKQLHDMKASVERLRTVWSRVTQCSFLHLGNK
jgi:hypothetical protein